MSEQINAALRELGITIDSRFVAVKYENIKDAKLNWWVTLLHDGRPVLSTEYSAGIAHIKGYTLKPMTDDYEHACLAICNGEIGTGWRFPKLQRPALNPADVVYCLINDSEAINHPDFESWASEYGYDEDSRRAEKIYRACLDIGLKMRSSLGDNKLEKLRELFQDY